jgi:WD40 repeat protein
MSPRSRFLLAASVLLITLGAARAADAPADAYGDPLPPGALVRMGTVRLRHAAHALAFAPDGKTFATGGVDNLIRLWNVADGKEIHQFKGHEGSVTGLAFSPDGKHLFSYAGDGTLRQWDAADGKEIRSFPGIRQGSLFAGLVAHPTEPRLVLLDKSGAVREWDRNEGKQTRNSTDKSGAAVRVLSPNGVHYAALKDNVVTLFDVTGKELQRFPAVKPKLRQLAFSPDGKVLLGGCAETTVVLWDVKKNEEIRTLENLSVFPQHFALSPDGKTLAVEGDRSVRLVEVATGAELYAFDIPNTGVTSLTFSPDGKTLACCPGSAVRLFDVEKGKPLHDFPGHSYTMREVRFSPDGKRLTSTSLAGTMYWWDAATGKPLASWSSKKEVTFGAAISPDGSSIFPATFDGVLRCDFNDGKPAEQVFARQLDGYLYCSAVSANGKVFAVRGPNFSVHFLDPDGKKLGVVPGDTKGVQFIALSPDGTQMAGGGRGLPVSLWDVPTGRERMKIGQRTKTDDPVAPLTSSVHAACFTPDGRGLLLADNRVVWWDVAARGERWRYAPSALPLGCVTVSADGRMVAAGTQQGAGIVYVLDAATGAELGKFTGHSAAVRAVHFAPDGKRLASASDDGAVLVWDTAELSKKIRPEAVVVKPEQLPDLWRDLADKSAAKGYKAVQTLAGAPAQSVPYLQKQLQGNGDDAARVKKLIEGLDDNDFAKREQAQKELAELGPAAVPALRKALKETTSAEVQGRIERLLEKAKDPDASTDRLREVRAVEVLERAATPEAVEVLKKLAGGDDKVPLTQDAKAALERLTRREPKP